jgi:hypothetical protein
MDYAHVHQNETQGEHWTHWSSTLFPVVVYYRDKSGEVWAHSYTYLSPDGKHDNAFVQHVNEHLISEVKKVFTEQLKQELKVVHFVSDGCRGQFKLRRQWFWLSSLEGKSGVEGRHRYFQSCHGESSSHGSWQPTVSCTCAFASLSPLPPSLSISCYFVGKGPSDGLGATYKSNMTAAELRGVYMVDTYAAFRWLMLKFVCPTRRKSKHKKERHSVKKHNFFYVPQHGECEVEDKTNVIGNLRRKRTKEMEGGSGSKSMEHFDYLAPGNLQNVIYRWLSHSCPKCIDGKYSQCSALRANENVPKTMLISEKSHSGAAEGKAILRERVENTRCKLKVGQFVALWQEQDSKGNCHNIAKVAKAPRKSVTGELVGSGNVQHSQYWVVEVYWGERVAQGKSKPDMYKFDAGECCEKTNDMCGSAVGCSKVHSHKVFLDVVLPRLDLCMVLHGVKKQSRTMRKRKRQQQEDNAISADTPEFWVLPPGSRQSIMTAISDDVQAGVSYTRYT